jgi:hypothetical protein
MIGFYRAILLAGGLLAAVSANPAQAQENFDAGKTPAQLYAADCAICHKTPQGLTKGGGVFGLTAFLREHYTASREAAAAIASYLQSVDKGPPAQAKRTPGKRTTKGEEKGKPGEPKAGEPKAGEIKSETLKSSESKTGKSKSDESKSGDAKPSETKPSETKSGEAKAVEPKPVESKADEAKPAAKDEKSEKKSE